jgi:iron(III) transport system permease protein
MVRPVVAPRASARAPWLLATAGWSIGLVFALPLLYLGSRLVVSSDGVVDALVSAGTVDAAWRTVALAAVVAATTAVLGTALAWFTTRTDLPFRRAWQVLVPLPLVFPSFVGAIALLNAVAPGGLLEAALGPLGVEELPRIQGFGGSWFVLTLFTYPLVQLPVAARLRVLPPSLEESARLLGRGTWSTFRTVVLPQTRTAVSSGALLVFLYVLSDFGVVQLMRYDTLTRVIYENRLARPAVAQAAAVLVGVLAILVVVSERQVQRRGAVEVRRGRAPHQVRLGRWRWPAALLVGTVVLNALVGPLLSLGYWVWRDLRDDPEALSSLATSLGELVTPAANTAGAGLGTAVVAVALVLPVAYLTTRYRGVSGRASDALVTSGFALPGIAIALSLVFWTLKVDAVSALYQTMPVLILAYVVHFGAQAMRASQVAVTSVSRNLDDAGRLLGASRARRLLTIDLPLMRGGLLAGAGLVLLSVMKELPATLLLAPTGFDTLATEIWGAQETHSFSEMGLAAIVLVAVSGLLTWLLVVRRADALD